MPEIGIPILSTMLLIASGGIVLRNLVVDLVDELGGHLLDARARRRAHMQPDLRRLDRGEEVLAEVGHEHERGDDGGEKEDDEAAACAERHRQQRAIATAQPLEIMLEAALEA